MDIEFKEGAVCFADGAVCYADDSQWFLQESDTFVNNKCGFMCAADLIEFKAFDFQLNTIKQGDYIEASELYTEQKYNDAVDVFGLFGFNPYERKAKLALRCANEIFFASDDLSFIGASEYQPEAKRKLTYPQLMAIGELKRLELECGRGGMLPNHFLPKAGECTLSEDVVNKQEIKMQKNKPVVAQVMIDLTERMETGIKTYGEALRANNGRDALQDAYEEALDLACYLKQAMIERDNANTNQQTVTMQL